MIKTLTEDPGYSSSLEGGYNRTSILALRHLPRGCQYRQGCRVDEGRGRPLLHRLVYTGTPRVEEGDLFYTGTLPST